MRLDHYGMYSIALALILLSPVAGARARAGQLVQRDVPPQGQVMQRENLPHEEVLPPPLPWAGESRALVVPPDDPWVTPAEASSFERTPGYAETVVWLQRLCAASPGLALLALGKSPEGRDIWMVVASAEGISTPEALRASGKPILLAQAGIHAGEIDGKDAGLMLLRDMTVRGSKRELLEGAHFLFIPIFNVDGHERFSAYSRINQRGPAESGWRTTARNLNLNRDYTKLDSPEMRHLVRALNTWQPDLYVDLHVTDGADYQYDITWGGNGRSGYSPASGRWLEEELGPALERDLKAMGHVPGPLVFLVEPRDPGKGMQNWTSTPRFSNGYGDARHLPTLLVENHSLKPYEQRVLGTYVLLEGCMRALTRRGEALRRAVRVDRERRPREIALDWKRAVGQARLLDFLGVDAHRRLSSVTGELWLGYTGEPIELRIPVQEMSQPAHTVRRPRAYWIPPAWTEVGERLAIHGIEMERLDAEREIDVEMYRVVNWKLASEPFEGRVRVTPEVELERRREKYGPGSVRVPTDQPLGELAVLLLEPESPDSFFQWGFFLEVLQCTEYAESYVLEPLAQRMLDGDPALRSEYERALVADSTFAAEPKSRLRWFYKHTPYFDARCRLYPVGRE